MSIQPEIRLVTDLKQIREIYNEHLCNDFPENELTPWVYMKTMVKKGEYVCYGLFAESSLLGYAFFIKQKIHEKQVFLFDYFAIVKPHRDEGFGSRFLKLLNASFKDADCVIGEVEDPEAAEDAAEREQRERRIRFYEQNGFQVTNAKAVFRGVTYRLAEAPAGTPHAPEALQQIYAEIYRQLAPAVFLKQHFRLLPL